jgi:hypothetical protein
VSIEPTATLDLNGSSLTIGSLPTSTGTITDNGTGSGTDTLTISGSLGAGNGTLITNGATRAVAVVANSTRSARI